MTPAALPDLTSLLGSLSAALALGVVLGGVCFGGLWWTVRRGLYSSNPVLWFGLSALLRMALVLSGFYVIAQGGVSSPLLACLLGLLIARFVAIRIARQSP